jgi:tRNA/rRNA methyltransferase
VALVFGNETAGLSNEEVALCRLPVMIPTNPDYSSLNLAAAVQVMCYELRLAALDPGAPPAPENPPATARGDPPFLRAPRSRRHAERLPRPGAPQAPDAAPAPPVRPHRLERDEVSLLRGMLKTFMKKPGDKVD